MTHFIIYAVTGFGV